MLPSEQHEALQAIEAAKQAAILKKVREIRDRKRPVFEKLERPALSIKVPPVPSSPKSIKVSRWSPDTEDAKSRFLSRKKNRGPESPGSRRGRSNSPIAWFRSVSPKVGHFVESVKESFRSMSPSSRPGSSRSHSKSRAHERSSSEAPRAPHRRRRGSHDSTPERYRVKNPNAVYTRRNSREYSPVGSMSRSRNGGARSPSRSGAHGRDKSLPRTPDQKMPRKAVMPRYHGSEGSASPTQGKVYRRPEYVPKLTLEEAQNSGRFTGEHITQNHEMVFSDKYIRHPATFEGKLANFGQRSLPNDRKSSATITVGFLPSNTSVNRQQTPTRSPRPTFDNLNDDTSIQSRYSYDQNGNVVYHSDYARHQHGIADPLYTPIDRPSHSPPTPVTRPRSRGISAVDYDELNPDRSSDVSQWNQKFYVAPLTIRKKVPVRSQTEGSWRDV